MSAKWYYARVVALLLMIIMILVAAAFTVTANEIPAVIAWVVVAALVVAITRSYRWEERQEISRWKRATRAAKEKRAQEETLQRAMEIRRGKRPTRGDELRMQRDTTL